MTFSGSLYGLKRRKLTAVACALTVGGWSALWGQAVLDLDLLSPLVPAAAFFGGLALAGIDSLRERRSRRERPRVIPRRIARSPPLAH